MLRQCFGDRPDDAPIEPADVISALSFDGTGEYLATGDKGGRVVVFKGAAPGSEWAPEGSADQRRPPPSRGGLPEYRFHAEFQSHEAEFDYLKSLEIEEKINHISWCNPVGDNLFLLSANDKTVKLWKVHERQLRTTASRASTSRGSIRDGDVHVPRLVRNGSMIMATPRRVYSNAHAYHINSVSPNSDGESFLSADDLRIHWWNFEHNDRCFNILDMKPNNMEELTEVITSAKFHPSHCHTMMFSSSRGTLKLFDTRQSALCSNCKVYEDTEDNAPRSFFSEIIASISDAKFTWDGRYMVSRDYLTLKVWDLAMENRPVKTINVHEHLRPKLCDLYDSDCIFDKFELAVSPDGNSYATGSYSNVYHVYDRLGRSDTCIELSKHASEGSAAESQRRAGAMGAVGRSMRGVGRARRDDGHDFEKKVLHLDWHPQREIIAVAGLNKLYVYGV